MIPKPSYYSRNADDSRLNNSVWFLFQRNPRIFEDNWRGLSAKVSSLYGKSGCVDLLNSTILSNECTIATSAQLFRSKRNIIFVFIKDGTSISTWHHYSSFATRELSAVLRDFVLSTCISDVSVVLLLNFEMSLAPLKKRYYEQDGNLSLRTKLCYYWSKCSSNR